MFSWALGVFATRVDAPAMVTWCYT